MIIPKITNPLGSAWRQPPREEILIGQKHAVMTQKTFSQLANYSHSTPTGVYKGKMWRSCGVKAWFLMWYDISPDDPELRRCHSREILIA